MLIEVAKLGCSLQSNYGIVSLLKTGKIAAFLYFGSNG